ncbi:MAG: lysophospholipid acyltransferase family protein [Polyangiaceae bacterium]|nr:lysophospholipid acyltransferase family protein [Polyangiaceae bacterium]
MVKRADRREGEPWTSTQRVKNDVLWLLARTALAASTHVPRRVLVRLGAALGAVAYHVLPSVRRTALENVARAFPELAPCARGALVRKTYATLGAHLGDVVAMLDPSRPLRPLPFADGARACMIRAIAEGRGVVFASAHIGPWERVAASLVVRGVPLTVVAREAYDPRFTAIYDRLRGGRGVRAIYRGARGTAARLLRTLRRGEVLGIPMDLASRVPSIDVPFLGVPAPTAVGPARLALRTGAAVVVGTAAPAGDGHVVVTMTRITTADLDPTEAGERTLTARINEELSRRIRAMPEAWVWMHPRWPASA